MAAAHLLVSAVVVLTPPAQAPRPEMVTDRPDFTESTQTVPPGLLQLESGLAFTRPRSGPETTEAGEALLRIGVSERWEARIQAPSWAWSAGGEPEGFTDAGIGFKVRMLDPPAGGLSLSLLGGVSLPTGADGLGDDGPTPELKLLWGFDLDENWSLAGNLNAAVPEGDDGRFFEPAASVSLARSINEWLGMYVEYYGFYPINTGEAGTHYINGGLTVLLTPDLQLDWRIGTGLGGDADELFIGAGVSVRF